MDHPRGSGKTSQAGIRFAGFDHAMAPESYWTFEIAYVMAVVDTACLRDYVVAAAVFHSLFEVSRLYRWPVRVSFLQSLVHAQEHLCTETLYMAAMWGDVTSLF